MTHKNAFWILLICVTALSFAPMSVQAAPRDVAPPSGPQKGSVERPSPVSISRDEYSIQRTVSGPYRLTYTFIEMDGEKRIGSQHYAVVLDSDSKISLRLGTKVPITTSQGSGNFPNQQQISYIDIGLSIDVRLRQFANGLELETHVAQSALESQESSTKDPVVRQTDLDSSALLREARPVVLGMLDTPESTHRLEIQVELTKIP
jgi:type II secretory pathway component GspD/PulD (secretin)